MAARAAVALSQAEIFTSGMFYEKIAFEAGVNSVTAGRLASGDTKRPALETVARILGVLGWEVVAMPQR